jgi:hypothetical protein
MIRRFKEKRDEKQRDGYKKEIDRQKEEWTVR